MGAIGQRIGLFEGVRRQDLMETVMCKNCLREVAAGSECEICGASLTDERGRYEMPCVELGLSES